MQAIHNKITDIIWLQTAFIGDLVLSTGAIELAARYFPETRQHIISTAIGCEVLKGSPFIQERIPFTKKGLGLKAFQAVKKSLVPLKLNKKTTIILQAHRSFRSTLLCQFLGFPTITYQETSFSWLANQKIPRPKDLHEVIRVALLLEPLGVPRSAIMSAHPHLEALPLNTELAWQEDIQNYQGQILALAVGSQWGTKRWPLGSYQALIQKLKGHTNLGLVLLGSKLEKKDTDQVEAYASELEWQGPLWNLAGRTSFDDLRRIYPHLDILVSNDSSPVHFASAFNVPTLAIFGPTVPAMGFGPLAPKSLVAEKEGLPCRPCSAHGPQSCPLKHFSCMEKLSVDVVYKSVCHLLG